MIEAISTNGLLSMILGPGKATGVRGTDRGQNRVDAGTSQPSGNSQPVDVVELSGRGGVEASAPEPTQSPLGGQELSESEEKEVRELKQRDAEVRRHEQAHKSAAGAHATGGPTYEFQTGPDGKRYAVGGEVSIDTSPVAGNPQATIRKMQQIRRAALAPAQPSGQDRAVAAQAQRAEQEARAELREERAEKTGTGSDASGHLPATLAYGATSDNSSASGRELDLVA